MVATKDHCVYCFDVLAAHLEDRDHIKPNFDDDAYPLFVTWNLVRKDRSQLRGCIGNFNPQNLHSGLKEYALTSALRDRRFSPIASHEIAYLTCSVSLLTDFEKANHYLDWEVGVHGIWIEFTDDHGRRRTATYLPDVMPEQQWTKMEAIDSLLRKGGFRGSITRDIRETIVLTRYQSAKSKITYQEYIAHIEILAATANGAPSSFVMPSVTLTTKTRRTANMERSVEIATESSSKTINRGRR